MQMYVSLYVTFLLHLKSLNIDPIVEVSVIRYFAKAKTVILITLV